MSLLELLENFGESRGESLAQPVAGVTDAEVEKIRTDAYETGYKAGWDDADKMRETDLSNLSSALSQNLRDLSFTYHEAHDHLTRAMTPLLENIVGVLLPGLSAQALRQQIVSQLEELAAQASTAEVEVAVHASNTELVRSLLETDFGFPLRLSEDATLTEDQADLRFDTSERHIDIAEVLRSATEAVQGFAFETQKATSHG